MRGLVNEVTVPGNAYSRENVVSCTHNFPDTGLGQLIKDARRGRLQLVFKDDESNEIQSRLCFVSFHLLNLHPIELRNVLSSTSNDAVPPVGIICQKFLVVARNCVVQISREIEKRKR